MNIQLLRNSLSLLFIAVSLGSATYVVAAGLNYDRFYPALSQLGARVDRVLLEEDATSGNTLLKASVVMSNPTDYSGLRVYAIELRLFFVHQYLSNVTLFKDQPLLSNRNIGTPLGPRSTITSDLDILLLPGQSASFTQFNQTHTGQVLAHTTLRVQVNTFLDPVIGRVVRDTTSDIPV